MKRKRFPSSSKQEILDILVNKYQADPQGFQAYLPEIASILDAQLSPSRIKQPNPFGLTEREREQRQLKLKELLDSLDKGVLQSDDAVRALEHCAMLTKDDSLPSEIDYEILARLFKAITRKSPGSFEANTTFPVLDGKENHVVNHVSLLRGVTLNLTWDMRLVSITINPPKMDQRRKALKFVGVAQDSSSEVAQRHDDYLAGTEDDAAS